MSQVRRGRLCHIGCRCKLLDNKLHQSLPKITSYTTEVEPSPACNLDWFSDSQGTHGFDGPRGEPGEPGCNGTKVRGSCFLLLLECTHDEPRPPHSCVAKRNLTRKIFTGVAFTKERSVMKYLNHLLAWHVETISRYTWCGLNQKGIDCLALRSEYMRISVSQPSMLW